MSLTVRPPRNWRRLPADGSCLRTDAPRRPGSGVIGVRVLWQSRPPSRCCASVIACVTTATAARAGVSQVITPMFGDQFYWASRIVDLGVGATIPHGPIRQDSLTGALREIFDSAVVVRATRAYHEQGHHVGFSQTSPCQPSRRKLVKYRIAENAAQRHAVDGAVRRR
jgi:hypothetical protein